MHTFNESPLLKVQSGSATVQDRLSGSAIFSTLDLRSGYRQMPVNQADITKTAFCPGPGMGLFQFRWMPFGLTGAPSSFQRMMDKIFQEFPFVTTYIDDVLIHSANLDEHKKHSSLVLPVARALNISSLDCTAGLQL